MIKEDVNGTIRLLEQQIKNHKITNTGKPFDTYQKVYGKTNENIKEYINKDSLKEVEKTLTVLGSGDHTFNLIENNILDIDTFDTNVLTYYFSLGIKLGCILKYNYKDYLKTIQKLLDKNTSIEETISIIKGLYPYLDKDIKEYWEHIINYSYKVEQKENIDINLLSMLLINTEINDINNGYLKDEESYNKLRENLRKAKITFKKQDCLELGNNNKNQYDRIYLSNIPDYFYRQFGMFWEYEKLREYEKSIKTILKENGIVYLDYLYLVGKKNKLRENVIPSSNIKTKDLQEEQIITFPHIEKGKELQEIKDGVLILKKNNKHI